MSKQLAFLYIYNAFSNVYREVIYENFSSVILQNAINKMKIPTFSLEKKNLIRLKIKSELLFTFFYTHKKKVLDSRKFSTSGFRWIGMF